MVYIIIIIAALPIIWGITTYNALLRLRRNVLNSWAQIDVQLKRRHDLIPNLVNTVKGYASHEASTFAAVATARTHAMSAGGPAESIDAEKGLTSAVGRLLALAEAYPQLRASSSFLELQTQLADTENRIALKRETYNDAVTSFNTRIQTFPAVLIASSQGFVEQALFSAEAAERVLPEVRF